MITYLQNIIDNYFTLQTPGTAYYSEASIQLKMGIEIYKKLGVEPIMEKKIPNTNNYLDIFANFDNKNYGIELKYKTARVSNNAFEYKHQGAQNNGRYDFIEDVRRLEEFKNNGIIDIGYAILITNDSSYWSKCRPGTAVALFELPEKKIIKGTYIPVWQRRTNQITLKNSYTINWSKPQHLPGATSFRYCIIKV